MIQYTKLANLIELVFQVPEEKITNMRAALKKAGNNISKNEKEIIHMFVKAKDGFQVSGNQSVFKSPDIIE